MQATLIHKAIVTKISPDSVTVALKVDNTDCHGCAISMLCTKGEMLEIPMKKPSADMIGREVTVSVSQRTQARAIILFFVMPMILLFGSLFFGMAVGMGEVAYSLLAIGVLVAWFVALYLMRTKLENKVNYKITEYK